MNPQNRRRDPRVRVSFLADRQRAGVREPGTLVEASARGLQVFLPEAPQLGELMRLVIHLPEGALVLHVVTMRVTESCDGALVACRTFALSGSDKLTWEQMIRGQLEGRAKAA